METAITLVSPPEMTLGENEKGQLSALVQIKLEETKTLTLVSTDEQFETAGEQLKAIALLRERIKGTLKPFIEFWHQGHKAHTGLLATLDGPLEARERSMKQGLARYQKEKEEARRREEERLRREAEELRRRLEEEDRKRREAEAAAARRRLEEEALAEAAAREAAGDHETAELILEHAEGSRCRLPPGAEVADGVRPRAGRRSEVRHVPVRATRVSRARPKACPGAGQRLRSEREYPRD